MTYNSPYHDTIGIDASRSISGGAVEHLKGILQQSSFKLKNISKVYLWAPSSTLLQLPNFAWLEKQSTDVLGNSIIRKIFWQLFTLPKLCKKLNIDVIFNTDAGSFCTFKPSVTLLQDIIPFERDIISKYKYYQKSYYRNLALQFIYISSLTRSSHIIFLSKYSKKLAENFINIKSYSIIPHGVDQSFYKIKSKTIIKKKGFPINVLYVSNALIYKNQWNVITAIAEIRNRYNLNIHLNIVGGGSGSALKKMHVTKKKYDKENNFIKLHGFSSKEQIKTFYQNSHIFIFASSCEAFGITLLEAMCTGIPIACSNKSTLPEIIKQNAVYFDPHNVEEIIIAIMKIYNDNKLRKLLSQGSIKRSMYFNWKKASQLTWQSIYKVAKSNI